MHYLWKVITEFSRAFKNSIHGTYDKNKNVREEKIPAGSRIRLSLEDLYSDIKQSKATSYYSDDDIKKAIMLHEGDTIPGFPSIDAFLALLTPQLNRLKEPGFECINEVYSILEETAIKILEGLMEKMPRVKEELKDTVLKHL